tara:strand:- start:45935 stop:46084 length:150 start_codon:yes stop_codon:yes gene_type:complete
MILAFISGAVIGAVIFALVLKNNSKLQNLFNLVADKGDKIIKDNLKNKN